MKTIKLTESGLLHVIQKVINERKKLHEHQVFWPDDKGKPVPMGLGTSTDGDELEQHRGMGIKLIKPRVKDWWRAEEYLWDMEVDYDKFNREEGGVTFLMNDTPVAFYDNNKKTLLVYKR